MDNPRGMRGGQTIGDLNRDIEQFARRIHGSDRDALYKLHHQVVRPHVVQLANVGMIQRAHRPSLTLKAFRKSLFGNLDGDDPIEAFVASFVHFAHTARPDGVHYFVGAEARSWLKGHRS